MHCLNGCSFQCFPAFKHIVQVQASPPGGCRLSMAHVELKKHCIGWVDPAMCTDFVVAWVWFPHRNIAAQGIILGLRLQSCTFCHCMASKLELAILCKYRRLGSWKTDIYLALLNPIAEIGPTSLVSWPSEWVRVRCSLILGPQLLAAVCRGPQPPQICVHAMS